MSPRVPPAGDRTTRLLKDRIKSVFRHLPKGLAGHEESIHQMRVAGRRLRVALPLLGSKPHGRLVRRALAVLRQLTRAAGSSRDLDVSLALFEARLAGLGALTPERKVLRRRLRAARTRSRARMTEALLDLEIARLRRDLRRIVARRGEDVFTVHARLRRTRDRGGAGLRAAFEALGERFDPDGLHRLRIRCRRMRYTAEVSDALRAQPSEAPALLRRLQDVLGRIHDTQVLAQWLAGQAAIAAVRGEAALAAEAQAVEAFFRAEARDHHRALLELRPREVVDRALEAMGLARPAA